MDKDNTQNTNENLGDQTKEYEDKPNEDLVHSSKPDILTKKEGPSILALISFLLGLAYIIYIVSYFSSTDNIGAGLAAALVAPHMVSVGVAVIFNGLGLFLHNRNFMLVAGILYSVAIVLFPMYFIFVIVEAILSFIAYAKMGKTTYIRQGGDDMEKVKKPFYKKWWFWLIIIVIALGALGSGGDKNDSKENKTSDKLESQENKSDATSKIEDQEVEEEKKEDLKDEDVNKEEKEEDIPREFSSALKKAESYSKTMNMSKAAIHNQLTSEYGEKFSEEAANYAMENIQVDWKQNALEKAKSYQETMDMSPEAIRDQLTSEHGEQFTQEEADWAIENLPK